MHFLERICINVANGKGARVAIYFHICVIKKHWQIVDPDVSLDGI